MADELFVVKVSPMLQIKNFFKGIGLQVDGVTHPHTTKMSYFITVSEDLSLAQRLLKRDVFRAKVDLQPRVITVTSNNSIFLDHAKDIVSSIAPLMAELELTNGTWTIKVVE